MTLCTSISACRVNSYHQNNGLLFQFILVEFTDVFTEVQRLDALCRRSPSPFFSSDEAVSQEIKKNHHLIEASLIKLLGPTKNYMRILSWNFNEGLLPKLRTYCAFFAQNADTDEKEIIAMQHYVDKLWQHCLQALNLLKKSLPDRSSLLTALDKANSTMQHLAKLIARLIHQFRDDENVVFYVLRHHQTFDRLYGNRFVVKLIGKIYPNGLKEVQFFLTKKYADRGFKNTLPVIHSAIKEIEDSTL